MLLASVWVSGRTASGRATLAHALVDGTASLTRCGLDLEKLGWSRRFIPDHVLRWLRQGDQDSRSLCLTCDAAVAADKIRASRAA